MNTDYMRKMSADELEAYAKHMGFTLAAGKTIEDKIAIIEAKRSREAGMTLLGVPVSVPIKRLHDKRVTDLLAKKRTDEETMRMFRLIVGDESCDKVVDAATEDDGTVDNDALGYAIATLVMNKDLKNF